VKIKEFAIERYGPLKNIKALSLKDFNLFWGENEDGKTLSIDALVKMLLGKKTREFEKINRVDEDPEGYVILEDSEGKELKLPEKGTLTDFLGLSSLECRNIFIIRNSQLSIGRERSCEESEFYTNVTDRLVGLRTEKITKIKKKLKELGKLTRAESGAELTDREEFNKIKSKVEKAEDLIKRIDELGEEIQREGFDLLEQRHVLAEENLMLIEQRLENFEKARKREDYEKAKDALEKLKKALAGLKELKAYNKEDGQIWRDLERDIQRDKEEKEKLLAELEKNKEALKKINEELSKREKDYKILEERKKKIDEEIKFDLENYRKTKEKSSAKKEKTKFFIPAAIVSSVLLVLSILGMILHPSGIFTAFAILFLLGLLGSGLYLFIARNEMASLKKSLEKIKSELARFKLGDETFEGMLANVQCFEDDIKKKEKELSEIKRDKQILESKIEDLTDVRVPSLSRKIDEAEKKISEIKTRSGEENFSEYKKKLDINQKYKEELESYSKILENSFGGPEADLDGNIFLWEQKIKELEKYKDKARDIKYEESKITTLKEEKAQEERNLEQIEEKIESFQNNLKEVETEVNKLNLLKEELLPCQTSVDLKAVKGKLREFIDGVENQKNAAIEAIKIFEEIESEEKEKVSGLFGRGSAVSKYFNEITSGFYEEVRFNHESGGIKVKMKDGHELEADKLSAGTYDQLYFSIRLALGKKLLKEEKGFFILDDPFIKADPNRLRKQIDVLKAISNLGWQIIYFSAKGEIKDVLQEEINQNCVKYFELKV